MENIQEMTSFLKKKKKNGFKNFEQVRIEVFIQ